MNRDTAFHDELEKARRERVTEAIRALLVDDDVDTAGRHLAWAETAARAAKAAAPKSIHQVYVAGLILLVCLSLITLAWSLDKSENPVKLVLRVDGIQLQTAESWYAVKDAPVLGIFGRGFAEIGVPSLGDRLETEFRLTDLIGRIQSLEVSKDARVDLDFRPGKISVYVWNGTLRGQIAVASAKLIIGRSSSNNGVLQDLKTSNGMPPETIRFFGMHSDKEAKPVRLDIDTTSALQFANLVVKSIAFSREDPPRSGKRASTLLNADGRINNVDRPISLQARDWIRLDGISPARLLITRENGNANIEFDTMVDRIYAGATEKSIKDITPSWLEYLAENQGLGVVWGALVLLWGLAWRLRGLF